MVSVGLKEEVKVFMFFSIAGVEGRDQTTCVRYTGRNCTLSLSMWTIIHIKCFISIVLSVQGVCEAWPVSGSGVLRPDGDGLVQRLAENAGGTYPRCRLPHLLPPGRC